MFDRLNLDKIGMSTSLICAVHCAMAPLLLPVMALWGLGFIWGEAIEIGMLLFALAVGVFSLTKSYRKVHRKFYPFYFLVGGMGLIFLSHVSLPSSAEPFVLPVGALLVVLAHWLNYRLCKQCPVCESERADAKIDSRSETLNTPTDSVGSANFSPRNSALILDNEEIH